MPNQAFKENSDSADPTNHKFRSLPVSDGIIVSQQEQVYNVKGLSWRAHVLQISSTFGFSGRQEEVIQEIQGQPLT